MPFDFAAYTVLAVIAACLAGVLVGAAVALVVRWMVRRVRAHNTYVAMHRALGPMWVLDEDDEMDDVQIDELMRHAAGNDPEVPITRLEGER